MTQTDNWPSYADELGRKISEVVAKWAVPYDQGRLTRKEFYLIVSAVYDTTSGLAPRDVSDMLANMEKELRDEAARIKAAKARV